MKILVSGYYGFNNTGDEAILESIVNGFKKTDPGVRLVFLSNNPGETQKLYNVEAVPRNNLFRILAALASCDGFISGGGGLLQDSTSRKSFWYYIGLLALAQLFGKKTFVVGQGIGPIRSKVNRLLLKIALKNCCLVTVRDRASFDLIESLKITGLKLLQTADLAFILIGKSPDSRCFAKHPVFGVSVRNCLNFEQFAPKIASVADQLIEKYNAGILFIPFQWPEDIIACSRVMKLMKKKAELVKDAYNSVQMLGLIEKLDFLLGMRLHSLIFAVSGRVPAFGVSYDPKVGNFMDQASLPWVEVENFSVKTVLQEVKELLDDSAGVRNSLDFIREEMYTKCLDNFQVVSSLLIKGAGSDLEVFQQS